MKKLNKLRNKNQFLLIILFIITLSYVSIDEYLFFSYIPRNKSVKMDVIGKIHFYNSLVVIFLFFLYII